MEEDIAIKILKQIKDLDDLCSCQFYKNGVKTRSCIGCREEAIKTVLGRLEQDERVIEEMANKLVREEKINIQCRPLKAGEYANVTKDIIDHFRKKCE